ncbi:MAG: formylglycine-generating enzyme family protein, partial [Candidatus Poribacteria bacterium]
MADATRLLTQILNSKMAALTAIFYLFFISSCLSLTPPIEKPNSPKKENSEQNSYSLPRKRVIWRDSNIDSKPVPGEHNPLNSGANGMEVQRDENAHLTDKVSGEVEGMVLIPAGKFLMGSKEGEGDKDEQPQHEVYLSDYYIDKYEV